MLASYKDKGSIPLWRQGMLCDVHVALDHYHCNGDSDIMHVKPQAGCWCSMTHRILLALLCLLHLCLEVLLPLLGCCYISLCTLDIS